MRKIILTLSAVAALGVAAQPAAADAPATVTTGTVGGTSVTCTTIWQYGAYGAWGDYIDGCTATAQCPQDKPRCIVFSQGSIETQEQHGHRVTLNARERWGARNFKDNSCDGTDHCGTVVYAVPVGVLVIGAGEWASTQCNGQRDKDILDSDQTLGRVQCQIELEY